MIDEKNRTGVYHIEYIDDNHVRLTPKGEPVKNQKPSMILAYAGWTSVFIESWLLLTRLIPADGLSWSLFGLFFVLAVMASAIYSGKSGAGTVDIRVSISGKVFSEESDTLTVIRNGNVALCSIKLADLEKNGLNIMPKINK